jgi:hypothetical protein
VQFQFVKGFGLKQVAEIAPPAQNGAEEIVEIWDLHLIRDGDQADDHRTHLAQDCLQNQAFNRLYLNHSSRLRRAA